MPLFVCSNCHVIDNTACGGTYAISLIKSNKEKGMKIVCCECYTGKWHNRFPKEFVTSKEDIDKRNRTNFIYTDIF